MSTIGIDYGGRRIGVAVSESGVLASPHSVLANDGDSERVIEAIARLGHELDAGTYVVGLAKRTRTHAGERKFHEFAERLRQRTGRQVVLWDETLSTVEAGERLREAGRNRRRAGQEIDMAAATVILQSYLDAESGRES